MLDEVALAAGKSAPPPAEKKKAMAVFLKQASPAHLPDMCRF